MLAAMLWGTDTDASAQDSSVGNLSVSSFAFSKEPYNSPTLFQSADVICLY